MKQILLPTDFSKNAYNAISYAVQLYKNVDCQFYLLHTYTPSNVTTGNMEDSYSTLAFQKMQDEIVMRKMKETKEKILTQFHNTKHTFKTITAFSLLIPKMQEVIKESSINLVIMGTKGATGAKEIFLGTNTMSVIKELQCSVIAVPSQFEYQKPKEILFPTDYKFHKSNKYIALIKELCNEHKSRLHILNDSYNITLEEKEQQMKTFIETFFKDNVHLFHHSNKENLIEDIQSFEIKYNANFLIMINNKHNFLENLLFKPVVNQMVYHTKIPFLVIPSEEKMDS